MRGPALEAWVLEGWCPRCEGIRGQSFERWPVVDCPGCGRLLLVTIMGRAMVETPFKVLGTMTSTPEFRRRILKRIRESGNRLVSIRIPDASGEPFL